MLIPSIDVFIDSLMPHFVGGTGASWFFSEE